MAAGHRLRFRLVKSLPLVALFVPGTALLLSIGAVLGSGAGQFAPVWLAIAIGAALGDWVAYALGVKVGPALLMGAAAAPAAPGAARRLSSSAGAC